MCDAPGNNWWGEWTGQNNVLTGPENSAPGTPWPSWPRAATAVQLPAGCGTFLHNLMCTRNSTVETNLEAEFWLVIANIRGNDVHLAQLKDWIARVEMYLGYKNTLGIWSPTHVYGGFNALSGGAAGPAAMKGRLTMLMAFAETAVFASYDVGYLVQEIYAQLQGQYNNGLTPSFAEAIASLSSLPGLLHLVRSLVYADMALKLMPSYQNAIVMLYGLLPLVQWSIDGLIVNIPETMPGLYALLGLVSEIQGSGTTTGFLAGMNSQNLIFENILTPPCQDYDSCLLTDAGPEGVIVGALNFGFVDESQYQPVDVNPAWANFETFAELGVYTIMGQGTDDGTGEGWAGSFAISYPTHADALRQNGLAPAPFKRISALLAAAEMEAKAKAFDPANAGNPNVYRETAWNYLCMARQLGQFQNYPWQSTIDAVFESLYPGADNATLVDDWLYGNDTIGAVQFPLPASLQVSGCSNCHFGGSPPHPDWYTNPANLGLGVPSTCGDGHLDNGEICDDGNNSNGDSCNATCSEISCFSLKRHWLDPDTGTCYWMNDVPNNWTDNSCANDDPNGYRYVPNDAAEHQRIFDHLVDDAVVDVWIGARWDTTLNDWKMDRYTPETDSWVFNSSTTGGDGLGSGSSGQCGYWNADWLNNDLSHTDCVPSLKRYHLCERPRPGSQ